MFDRIVSLLTAAPEKAAPAKLDNHQVAVGALLVEAAKRDDQFDATERDAIASILTARFDLKPEEAVRLFAAAESVSNQSIEVYGFTRGMVKNLEYDERVKIIEMLWEVAYADGVLSHHEDALIRKIAGLIYVSDFDRGAARRRVTERLGIGR